MVTDTTNRRAVREGKGLAIVLELNWQLLGAGLQRKQWSE